MTTLTYRMIKNAFLSAGWSDTESTYRLISRVGDRLARTVEELTEDDLRKALDHALGDPKATETYGPRVFNILTGKPVESFESIERTCPRCSQSEERKCPPPAKVSRARVMVRLEMVSHDLKNLRARWIGDPDAMILIEDIVPARLTYVKELDS